MTLLERPVSSRPSNMRIDSFIESQCNIQRIVNVPCPANMLAAPLLSFRHWPYPLGAVSQPLVYCRLCGPSSAGRVFLLLLTDRAFLLR